MVHLRFSTANTIWYLVQRPRDKLLPLFILPTFVLPTEYQLKFKGNLLYTRTRFSMSVVFKFLHYEFGYEMIYDNL